jgi:hypothetical protein
MGYVDQSGFHEAIASITKKFPEKHIDRGLSRRAISELREIIDRAETNGERTEFKTWELYALQNVGCPEDQREIQLKVIGSYYGQRGNKKKTSKSQNSSRTKRPKPEKKKRLPEKTISENSSPFLRSIGLTPLQFQLECLRMHKQAHSTN